MNNLTQLSWACWNPQQLQLVDAFQRYGCSLVSCYPDGSNTGFVHTVGLEYSSEHPELLSVDLPKSDGKILIDSLATLVKDGRRFREGDVYEDLAGRSKVCFVAMGQQDFRHMAVAAWFYHYEPFRVLKVVAA